MGHAGPGQARSLVDSNTNEAGVTFEAPSVPPHLNWLADTGRTIKTVDGLDVKLVALNHDPLDDETLTEWANHFRVQYVATDLMDQLRAGIGLTREQYLLQYKFPSRAAPGPSIRSGDFAEILVADYLQWRLGYSVPRFRWNSKAVPNSSGGGSDLVGFRLSPALDAREDELIVCEVKASLSGSSSGQFSNAVDHSGKDKYRLSFTLNFLKQRMLEVGDSQTDSLVTRFQDPLDRPYKMRFAAVGVYSSVGFSEEEITAVDAAAHPSRDTLTAIVITGHELMTLAHDLYERAAREA